MKRFFIALVAVVVAGCVAFAASRYAHDASVLPAAAQNVISKNFKATVSVVKIDKKFNKVDEYEVVLTDGTEITFDAKGNWKEIETSVRSSVPKNMIPAGIAEYVKSNHKGQNIVGIEKGRRGYEVTLADGIEMKFDTNARFLRYD